MAGGAAGWISVAAGGGISRAASIAAGTYLSLLVLVPFLLVAVTVNNLDEPNMRVWYLSAPRALGIELFIGIGGAIAASLFFLVPSGILPVVLRHYDSASMLTTLRTEIGWGRFLLVLADAMAVSIIAAIVAYRSARE